MGARDLISGAFLTLLSLGAGIMAYRLGLGTGSNPGAGFAGFGIALLLGLMSVGMFVKALVRKLQDNKKGEEAPPIMWRKPVFILIILAAYGAVFNFLGFPLATFLLMTVLVWIIGRRRLSMALIVSILTVASSYALFVTALGLPLPLGSVFYIFGG
ncbi:MAG: tripartite tricarboxylate transporter TctB family protein [Deltaproteobacteria bacterium]|nr:tripartite tricarboxylate transporter TctB family protein [Deltaproteobacteria bacterium]